MLGTTWVPTRAKSALFLIKKIEKMFYFYMYWCLACVYICAAYVCTVLEGQKKALDLLELEIQVSHGFWELDTGPPGRAASALNIPVISLVPFLFFCQSHVT